MNPWGRKEESPWRPVSSCFLVMSLEALGTPERVLSSQRSLWSVPGDTLAEGWMVLESLLGMRK